MEIQRHSTYNVTFLKPDGIYNATVKEVSSSLNKFAKISFDNVLYYTSHKIVLAVSLFFTSVTIYNG